MKKTRLKVIASFILLKFFFDLWWEIFIAEISYWQSNVFMYSSKCFMFSDIDECETPELAAKCVENAECCNLPAHYVCKCNPGFEGDGEIECLGKKSYFWKINPSPSPRLNRLSLSMKHWMKLIIVAFYLLPAVFMLRYWRMPTPGCLWYQRSVSEYSWQFHLLVSRWLWRQSLRWGEF